MAHVSLGTWHGVRAAINVVLLAMMLSLAAVGIALAESFEPTNTLQVDSSTRLAPEQGLRWLPRWNYDARDRRLAMSFTPEGTDAVQLAFCYVDWNGKPRSRNPWDKCLPPGWSPNVSDPIYSGYKFVIDDMCWLEDGSYMYAALSHRFLTDCPGDSCGDYDIYKESGTSPTFYGPGAERLLSAARRAPLMAFLRRSRGQLAILVANTETNELTEIYRVKDSNEQIQGLSLHPDGMFISWTGLRVEIRQTDQGDEYVDLQDLDIVTAPLKYDVATRTFRDPARRGVATSELPRFRSSGEFLSSWDPTGRLRFACYHDTVADTTDRQRVDLVVFDLDQQGRVTTAKTVARNIYVRDTILPPSWSPDGKRLYYIVEDPESGWPLRAVDVPWTQEQTVMGGTHAIDSPTINHQDVAVSPCGTLLAVTALPVENAKSVFILKLDGN